MPWVLAERDREYKGFFRHRHTGTKKLAVESYMDLMSDPIGMNDFEREIFYPGPRL